MSRPGRASIKKATAFDAPMFGAPFSQKTRACFVRRCDATHLAAPKQKASAMKLLVAAENAPEDRPSNCSFGVGFKYRHAPATSTGREAFHHHLSLSCSPTAN